MKTFPLTLAASLIFWGSQTGYLFLSGAMAAVVALGRYFKKKWDPSTDQINKVSDTCAVCFAGAIVYFVSSDLETALKNILRLLPVLTFPLIVIQEFSVNRVIDIRALYLFRKKIPDEGKEIKLNLSLAFIIICLISSGAVNNRLFPYYPIILGIIVLVLFFQRPRPSDLRIWLAAVIAAAITGMFLHQGLHHTQTVMTRRAMDRILDDNADPLTGHTALGRIGRLKFSNRIVFRVIPPENHNGAPYLLKEAAYNFFSNNRWSAAKNIFEPVPVSQSRTFIFAGQPDPNRPFSGVTAGGQGRHPSAHFVPSKVKLTILSRMKKANGVLRAPEKTVSLSCNAIQSVKVNRLGTIAVDGAPGFITYDIWSGDPGPDLLAPGKMDCYIPDQEKELFTNLTSALNIGPDIPVQKKLSRIKTYFLSNFRYSLELEAVDKKSPITGFMTRTRTGHCEYFATATVLLLRSAGIPARYVSGYMAFEKNLLGDKIVVRRKHAHAWTQAYVNGKWVFFDTTPPAWAEAEKSLFLRTALPDLLSLMEYGFDLLRWGRPETKKKLLWLLVPLGVLLIRRLLQKDQNRSGKKGPEESLRSPENPAAACDFYIRRLETQLARSGFRKAPHETYEQFFTRINNLAFPLEEVKTLGTIIQIHKKLRFGPVPVSLKEQAVLEAGVDRLIRTLSRRQQGANAPD